MSAIKIYNTKTNTELEQKYDILKIKEYITLNSYSMFGVRIIATDFTLTNYLSDNLDCEIIGYDEAYRIVIFEFRINKYSFVIKNGLKLIDYILDHTGSVKVLIKDKVSSEVFNNLVFNPRLIVIGEDFSNSDYESINRLHYEIDLVKASYYNELLLINKMYQSFHLQGDFKLVNKNPLFINLHEEITSLGSDLTIIKDNSLITYRRLKMCFYILVNDELVFYYKQDNKLNKIFIHNEEDILKITNLIKQTYEEN